MEFLGGGGGLQISLVKADTLAEYSVDLYPTSSSGVAAMDEQQQPQRLDEGRARHVLLGATGSVAAINVPKIVKLLTELQHIKVYNFG